MTKKTVQISSVTFSLVHSEIPELQHSKTNGRFDLTCYGTYLVAMLNFLSWNNFLLLFIIWKWTAAIQLSQLETKQ